MRGDAALKFWLVWFLCLCPAIEAHASNAIARVRVEIQPDGIQATFSLSKATTRFDFATADVARDDSFEVVTPDIRYATQSVTSTKPFKRFVLRVRSATREYDGKYASLRTIGEGRVLYAYALKGDNAAWDTRMTFALPRGYVRSSPNDRSPNGNVFLGPSSYVKDRGTFTYIAPPNMPPALAGLIGRQFETAIATYTTKLKRGLPSKPVVIAQISPELNGFEGNVSEGFVTFLRFAAINWDKITPSKIAYFQSFIPHEVFHFWNGGVVDSNGSAAWLHEGSAEYASRLITIGDTPATRAALNAELSSNLNNCNWALSESGNIALDQVDFITGSVRYPCGMIMMWAADMRVRRDSGGQRTFFDIWADIVARGLARPDRTYSVADFDQVVRGESGISVESLRLMRDVASSNRFGAFIEALKAEGAVIEMASTIHTRRSGIIQHIVSLSCERVPGKSIGYGVTDNTVKLDTHDACGVISGSPTLTHIEGFDVNMLTIQNYASVQAKCAANQPLAFRLGDGRTVNAPCTRPLIDAQTAYAITSWKTE